MKLFNEGKTIREIAQEAHMSFGDISFIIRRETGEDEQQHRIRLSKSAQALQLFEQGKTPVEVAMKLDIETKEVDKLYKDYWNLKGLDKLNDLHSDLRENIFPLVKLYQLAKKEGMKPEQIVNLLKIAEELPHLESRYEIIRGNILALKRLEENLENELYQLNIYKEISSNQLELLRAEENRLRHLIDRLENADEYDKINKLVQKRVREILDNKKLIIGIALSVLIMSIRNEPDRRLVKHLLNEEMDASANQYYRQKLLELAEKCYQQLVNDCVNGILNSIPFEG